MPERLMKDSGVEWAKKIPSHWSVGKVKHGFNRKKSEAHQDDPVILSLARAGVKVRDISNNEGQIAESYYNYNPVEVDDLLLNPMDLYSGANCSISKVEGVISPAYANLRYKSGFHPKYYDYCFKVQYWLMYMFSYGKGVSFDNRWTLNNETLMNMPLLIPPYKEQEAIANYLDEKCEKIDRVIDVIKKSVEDYKELRESTITNIVCGGLNNEKRKECDVDFISQIPANWATSKMNNICKVITDYVASGSFASLAENVKYLNEPDYAMLVRTVDVSNKRSEGKPVYINKDSYDFLRNSNLFGGEIMLPNIGASVGDAYIVPKLYERMSLAPNAVMIRTKYIDKYYYYYFLSKPGRLNILDIAQSTAQAKFNKTDFRQMKALLPPIKEQEEIADYLDEKCEKIDALISEKEKLIKDLEAYKKSLIYECVTGKREVL